MWKIPLYRCYWCQCAYCINRGFECMNYCFKCQQMDKFKMPISECNNFLEKTNKLKKLYKELQKCDSCKYKKFYKSVKSKLKE